MLTPLAEDFVGAGTLALDPTFGSFTLLDSVSRYWTNFFDEIV
jgi:hypothetical protein